MSMRWRKGGAVAALLVLGFGLGACDGGEDPTPSPTTDPSPTETTAEPTEPPTTSAGPPEIDPPEAPEGMEVDDHHGAALAAGYFLELYNYMRATGDTVRFEAMSGPDCNFCAYSIELVEVTYEAGKWIEGGDLDFDIATSEVLLPDLDQPAYTVLLGVHQNTMIVHRADGPGDPVEGSDQDLAIGIEYTNGQFTVLGVNVEAA